MKKLLSITITLLTVMTINAQTAASDWNVVAEKDWTGGFEEYYPYWYQFDDDQNGSVTSDPDGVAITLPTKAGQAWQPQTIILQEADLEVGHTYLVRITAIIPSDGILQVNMGNWLYNEQWAFDVKASDDFQDIDVVFDNFLEQYSGSNADNVHVFFQSGCIVGTTIIKKVQVIDLTPADNLYDAANIAYNIVTEGNKKYAEVTQNAKKDYKGTVIIPSSVTLKGEKYTVSKIGDNAFSFTQPTSVVIPNTVTSIGDNAFNLCWTLKSVVIPSSVKSIGKMAFLTSNLSSINIPSSVTTIGEGAFCGCAMASVTIPSSVTSIGISVFSACQNLTSIKVSRGNSIYDSRDNCNAVIETSSNKLVAACKSTFIPNSVTRIGERAFSQCDGLTCINIPSSVTTLDKEAFWNCQDLTVIRSLRSIPPQCIEKPFDSVDKENCVLFVPKGSKNLYAGAGYWKEFKNIEEAEIGDVNLDGSVDMTDLIDLVDYIMGSSTKNILEIMANVNGDTRVDAADIVRLISLINER